MSQVNKFPFPLSDEFRRARKAILLTTSLIILLKFLKPTLTKITMLGVQLDFPEPEKIYIVLWLLWIYQFIRYYQYYRQDGLTFVNDAWRNCWQKYMPDKIREIVKPQIIDHPGVLPESDSNALLTINPASLRSVSFLYYDFNTNIPDKNKSGKIIYLKIKKNSLLITQIKTIFRFLRNNAQFTDMYIPFIYSFAGLVYCNIGCWQGSIFYIMGISCS